VFSKLEDIARDLEKWNNGVGVAETVGGGAGIGGGIAIVAGTVLLPVTGGASSLLIGVGAAAGTIGGVTTAVASVSGLIANQSFMNDARQMTKDFIEKLQLISHVWKHFEDSMTKAEKFSEQHQLDLQVISQSLSDLMENNVDEKPSHTLNNYISQILIFHAFGQSSFGYSQSYIGG
jgi:hypothetical protein